MRGSRPVLLCCLVTTRDTYWNPSSCWDLIVVNRNYKTGVPYQETKGIGTVPEANVTCNPIIIRFTLAKKRQDGKEKNLGTQVVQIGV